MNPLDGTDRGMFSDAAKAAWKKTGMKTPKGRERRVQMSNDLAQRQSFFITPPRAFGQLTGEVCALATSTSSGVLDLRTVGVAVPNLANSNGSAAAEGRVGLTGNFVSLYADARTSASSSGRRSSVTGANSPNLGAVGTVNGSGVYTNAAGVCAHIPAGTSSNSARKRPKICFSASSLAPQASSASTKTARGIREPARVLSGDECYRPPPHL